MYEFRLRFLRNFFGIQLFRFRVFDQKMPSIMTDEISAKYHGTSCGEALCFAFWSNPVDPEKKIEEVLWVIM